MAKRQTTEFSLIVKPAPVGVGRLDAYGLSAWFNSNNWSLLNACRHGSFFSTQTCLSGVRISVACDCQIRAPLTHPRGNPAIAGSA